MGSILPNTTQIPHIIIREWMPLLKDVELRVLLVVTDQTLGWIEDVATGRRKEKDWISHYQLREKTGRSDRGITEAIKELVEHYALIEAYSEQGEALNTPEKRQKLGHRIYYRLNLHHPPEGLSSTPAKSAGAVDKPAVRPEPPQILRTQKVQTTKETLITKENTSQPAKPSARIFNEGEGRNPTKPHSIFIAYWHSTVKRTRGIAPVITKADCKNLKRILDAGVDETQLEQMALFFLADYSFRKFSPSISTLLSSGIINGLLSRTKNDPEFWKKLGEYAERYLPRPQLSPVQINGLKSLQEGLENLRRSMAMPHQHHE